jgi:xylulokinase
VLADVRQVARRELPALDPATAYALAIDLGTGGPKVALVAADGHIAAHGFATVDLLLGEGGAAEQRPAEWWDAICRSARQAMADGGVAPENVVGVACTAQWSGTVAVGADGAAVCDALIWLDSRGASDVRALLGGPVSAMGYDVTKLARWVRLTGGVPSLSGKDPIGHIAYLRHHRPDVYHQTAVFLEPVDYLNLRLTGRARASFDSITAHWVTDNRDIGAVAYHPGLVKMAGLDPDRLPPLVPTGSVMGMLSADAAGDMGLLAGTPVATGTGDLHSAAVGSGAVGDFAAHLYIGTSSWISCHVPFKRTSPTTNVASIPSGLAGRYLVANEHETAGACLNWLLDNVLYPDDGLGAPRPDAALERLNEVAARVPAGANGVVFTPWLNGERSPVDDHTIRAGFHNMGLATTRTDLVRAAFEGVAFNSRWLLEAVEGFCKRPFGSLAFVGGGANSALWCQLHADICKRTIRQIDDPVLANVRGAGLLAHVAAGRVAVGDIPSMVRSSAVFEPNPDVAPLYDEVAAEFVELYKKTKAIHRHLNQRRLGSGSH